MSDFATQLGREIAENALRRHSGVQQTNVASDFPQQQQESQVRSEIVREAPTEDNPQSINAVYLVRQVKGAKEYWKERFSIMERDIRFVRSKGHYPDQDWHDERYLANFVQRHVHQRTSAIYAKNPTAVFRRAQRRDFKIWDGSMAQMQQAQVILQQWQQQAAQQEQAVPVEGQENVVALNPEPQKPLAVQQAEALIADIQAGQQNRNMLDAVGDTLVMLAQYFMREQKPAFKKQMKRAVRRAKTTGVAWCVLDYKEIGAVDIYTDQGLLDDQQRLDTLDQLRSDLMDDEFSAVEREAEELSELEEDLFNEDEIVLREGPELIFPRSEAVIIDPKCMQIDGFIGADFVAIEWTKTVDEIKALFKKDLSKVATTKFGLDGVPLAIESYSATRFDPEETMFVQGWYVYHRPTGLRYTVADGWPDYLEDAKAPATKVEGFYPIFALAFGELEEDLTDPTTRKKDIYPVSDVTLLRTQQLEYNRRRESNRQHRIANRPLYAVAPDAFDDEEDESVLEHEDHDMITLQALAAPDRKLEDIVQEWPKQNIDANTYETGSVREDVLLVAGSQEADMGGTSGDTATEVAVAEGKNVSSRESDVDDLDEFLSTIVRELGKLCLRKMPQHLVQRIVGPGAVWPELTGTQIAEEVFLEIEAGSSGRPNQAAEVQNLERMLPYIVQIPGIPFEWTGKKVVRAIDDKVDLQDAYLAGLPSITSFNQNAQASTGNPETDPNAQGPEGANNAPVQGPEGEGASQSTFPQQVR